MRNDGRGVLENVGGAALMGWSVLTPFLRARWRHWGTEDNELFWAYPGDELVRHPRWQFLHAVTVAAPREEVWPWVAQLGQGRGGFYSYELLENLFGCEMENAEKVRPELQELKLGDVIRLHPKTGELKVVQVEKPHLLVLEAIADLATGKPFDPQGPRPEQFIHLSWSFVLDKAPWGATRLFSRMRADFAEGLGAQLGFGTPLVEPISEVMDRKMLLGIKSRAETAYFCN